MNIPFSMSDEPDLGDEFKGIGGDYEHIEPLSFDKPLYTQEQMNMVILANIAARQDLQHEIARMNEDMNLLEEDASAARGALYDIRDWLTCSQSISALQVIIKRGLRE